MEVYRVDTSDSVNEWEWDILMGVWRLRVDLRLGGATLTDIGDESTLSLAVL